MNRKKYLPLILIIFVSFLSSCSIPILKEKALKNYSEQELVKKLEKQLDSINETSASITEYSMYKMLI